MPELPEVETIKRTLGENITGLSICNADLFLPKAVHKPKPEEFCNLVTGKTILNIGRRGKYLLIHLSGELTLVIHLRMTGRLIYTPEDAPVAKYTHLIFHLDNNHQLRFSDMRQFGRLWLVPQQELNTITGLKNLGVEPLSRELTPEYLQRELKRRRARLKPLLLDQTFIAGLGNIYADEALHRAGLQPLRMSSTLTPREANALFQSIKEVLEEGIASRGTTVRDYVDGYGQSGTFQEKLRVYSRQGRPCPRCGKAIQRLRAGGRSAYFCPGCQEL